MVELLVSDEIFRPEVVPISHGVRLLIPAQITFKEIELEVGALLTPVQLMEVFDLWCNDNTPREFEKTLQGYLIRLSKVATNSSKIQISVYDQPRQAL